MERASLHLKLYVTLYTISSSVRNVANIFMICAQGKMQLGVVHFQFLLNYFDLTVIVLVSVFLVPSINPVTLPFGCGVPTTRSMGD